MPVWKWPSLIYQTSECTHRWAATGCLYLISEDCCVVRQPIFQLTELMSLFCPQWCTKLDLFPRPGTRVCSLSHTQLRNTCIPSADPLWCLIPPHFSRPLLLSNWSSGEYNYGENHPGLMWGWINGIKKIICWPSGPATVWGWEGNLKQRGEEMVGASMSRRKAHDHWEPCLTCLFGDYFLQDSPPQLHLTAHIWPSPSRMFRAALRMH